MWFASQFIGYLLLRGNNYFEEKFRIISKEINLNYPYVAMHIRHGDKLRSEAKYIPEQKFVDETEKYVKFLKSEKRNVYIASDDQQIRTKLGKLVPKTYNLMMLPAEYRKQGLDSYFRNNFPKQIIGTMLTDIYFLVQSNFTICTYTSNICRLVNLLKQATYPYIADMKSLDDENIMYLGVKTYFASQTYSITL